MPNYTLQYVYQLSDFDTSGSNITPPNEQGARAAGSPPFNIALSIGASSVPLTITDDDPNLNEIGDNGQLLNAPVTLDGATYPAGTKVIVNYRLTDDDGFEGFSITLGENNTGNNTTTAFISNTPMVPGQTYVFTSEDNVGNNFVPYAELACFTAASLINTPQGLRPIHQLSPGDAVWTRDHGAQSVRWVGQRTVPGCGKFTPVQIDAGALGPHQAIRVSPNHRMLIEGSWPGLFFGQDRVLAAAGHLMNGRTIRRDPCGFVTYVHVLLARHELVQVNGAWSESFFPGAPRSRPQALEVAELFPEWQADRAPHQVVAPELRAAEARLLAGTI